MSPISNVKATVQEQLASPFELDSFDVNALPVTASMLDVQFKNTKFYVDEEDRKPAQAALLSLMKVEAKRQKEQQPPKSTKPQSVKSDQPPPFKKPPVQSPWDIIGVDFDEKEYTDEHHLKSEKDTVCDNTLPVSHYPETRTQLTSGS